MYQFYNIIEEEKGAVSVSLWALPHENSKEELVCVFDFFTFPIKGDDKVDLAKAFVCSAAPYVYAGAAELQRINIMDELAEFIQHENLLVRSAAQNALLLIKTLNQEDGDILATGGYFDVRPEHWPQPESPLQYYFALRRLGFFPREAANLVFAWYGEDN